MKVELERIDYLAIKDLALSYYKELDCRDENSDVFWAKCVVRAVVGVINNTNGTEIEVNLPAPDWKRKRSE